MFAKAFFPKTYFAGTYFPPIDGEITLPDGGIYNYRIFGRVRRMR